MGQKIHPTGFRLSVNRNWSSKWYANSKTFANTLFEDRLTQLDVRVAKSFRFGGARVRAMADVYNLLNANTVLSSNGRYGGTTSPWPLPTAILGARTFKFGAELTF